VKALLALLFAGKLGKILLSGGSMLISIAVYAQLFGWKYAVGFVLLLLCHEMGHYIAPDRGAWRWASDLHPLRRRMDQSQESEFERRNNRLRRIGWAAARQHGRPSRLSGALQYQSHWLLAIAYAGFVLNLFNLIPSFRSMEATSLQWFHRKSGFWEFPWLVALYLWRPNPYADHRDYSRAAKAWAALRGKVPVRPGPELASNGLKARFAAEYLGLVCFLT